MLLEAKDIIYLFRLDILLTFDGKTKNKTAFIPTRGARRSQITNTCTIVFGRIKINQDIIYTRAQCNCSNFKCLLIWNDLSFFSIVLNFINVIWLSKLTCLYLIRFLYFLIVYNALRNNRMNEIYNIRHIHFATAILHIKQLLPYRQNCVIPLLTVYLPYIRMCTYITV